jgi:hypothetical protein
MRSNPSSTDLKKPKRPSWGTAPRRHNPERLTPSYGTASGASGLRQCERSWTRLGPSGLSRATCATATPVGAFF